MDSKQEKHLTGGKIFGYCLGDIFGGGAFTLVGMLYMNYLTDSMLISGAVVGVMLFLGKIWDAIIDPFIGNISEKASSKIGRRRIFFFAGIFHIAAAFISLWLPLESAPVWVKVIYFTLAYMLFATSFSLTMVPYHAMLPELTTNQKKRNRIVSLRSIFSNASSMIAGLVPSMLITMFSASGNGYLGMGIVFGIFYTIPWIFVFFSTKGLDQTKPDITVKEEGKKENIFKAFITNAKTVLKNRSFRKMLGLYLLSYTAMDIFMAIFIYYFKWYLGIYNFDVQEFKVLGLGAYTFMLGIFMIAELCSIPIYTMLCNKIGKGKSFIISTGFWAFATVVFFIMATPEAWTNNQLYMLIIPAALMGLGAGGVAYIPWAMLPETMDAEELITGERKDAIYSGFLTFIRQLSQAIAMLIIGIYLTAIDEDVIGDLYHTLFNKDPKLIAHMTQVEYKQIFENLPEGVGFGIKLFTSLMPFILLIGALVVSTQFPINNKTYLLMQDEITNRNHRNKEEIETLTKIVGKKNVEEMLSQTPKNQ